MLVCNLKHVLLVISILKCIGTMSHYSENMQQELLPLGKAIEDIKTKIKEQCAAGSCSKKCKGPQGGGKIRYRRDMMVILHFK